MKHTLCSPRFFESWRTQIAVEIALLVSLLGACGQSDSTENYGITQASQLTLSAQNHPHGFGQTECFSCHVETNIHQIDRVGSNQTALARQMVQQSGISICYACHGRNGVTP